MKFQDLPIKRKLTLALMLTAGVTLLLACGAFVAVEVVLVRRELVNGLTTRAEILAANSAGALAFADHADAQEVLGALRVDRRAAMAALYDKDGKVFATYPPVLALALLPGRPEGDGHRFTETHLLVFHPVMQGERRLGTIFIKADLSALRERLVLYGWIACAVVLVAAGVAFVLASKLQAKISRPILLLSNAAREVAERKDYSVRAPALGTDELGQLTTAFNEMLARIHERDMALSENEARHRAILESSLDAVITMDHEGRIVEFNPAAEGIFGWSQAAVVGRLLAEVIIPPALRTAHQRGLARYLATGAASVLGKRLELTAVRVDGSEFPVEVAITRISKEDPPLFTGFIRELTERKQAEEAASAMRALGEEKRLALEASRMKSEFLANMSHELRTPLNGIIGFSEFLMDGKPGPLLPKQKEYLGCVLDSGRHLLQLINDVLDLSKVEAGKMEMNPETFRLAKAVEEACAVARAIAQKKRIQVQAEVASELAEVTLDQQKFKQVLYNLLSNAVKFTNDGGRVDISLRPLDGDRFQVQVRDSGIGIRAEDFPKLFREFTQLDSGSARRYGGTGLGLSLTRKIVEFQHGTISVASEPGVGSTFTVELPRSLPRKP